MNKTNKSYTTMILNSYSSATSKMIVISKALAMLGINSIRVFKIKQTRQRQQKCVSTAPMY